MSTVTSLLVPVYNFLPKDVYKKCQESIEVISRQELDFQNQKVRKAAFTLLAAGAMLFTGVIMIGTTCALFYHSLYFVVKLALNACLYAIAFKYFNN